MLVVGLHRIKTMTCDAPTHCISALLFVIKLHSNAQYFLHQRFGSAKNSTLNPKAEVAVVNEAASFYDPLNFGVQKSCPVCCSS